MPFAPGTTVGLPKDTCAAGPLRVRCTTGSHGRSVAIHPEEALLAGLRQRQQDPDGRAKLRERAYRREVPAAEVHVLDAGHFALDEQPDAIADLTRGFLGRPTRNDRLR